ncbi:MAG: hypothetical protein KBF45_01350 [Cyclobacteriaceae bacterium]|jgi:hypothetical protein|nr:hypothetical protein [Cyclobacteriaceae bacterium]
MENLAAQIPYWTIYKKIAFRFAFIFLILFIVFLDYYSNFLTDILYEFAQLYKLSDIAVFGAGKYLFHIPYTIIKPVWGDHSDSTYIYLLYFLMIATAGFGAAIWSVLDRKRTHYETLYYWLTVIARYYLALNLFAFALEKFFKAQFNDLGLYALTETFGDMSPMGMAYAFFGYSNGYNYFMGIVECAALLLLFRRTMTFGALVTLGALANIMAINYNYDLHAKMYPTVMFVMTIFLLLPHANRVIKFFFTNQATSLVVIKAPIFKKRWMNITKVIFKFLVIGFHIIFLTVVYWDDYSYEKKSAESNSKFYGMYDVESYVVNTDTLSLENPLRWNQFVIGGNLERVRLKSDSILFMNVSFEKKEILVYRDKMELQINKNEINEAYDYKVNMDSILVTRQIKSKLYFELSDSTTLQLKGKVKSDSVFITAQKRPLKIKDFRLMKRGFHWITEVPYFY